MANRLAQETSPYLLQHANNPVDWYPWGDEALAMAKAEDRPILLSIGYSACHWCHVMERESFEDPGTAEVMNRDFVPIKVDREERPDLDAIYMSAVQQMTGSGGWPMTVFLTPDLRPFFGGTYFPDTARYGMPSFMSILEAVAEAYRDRRAEVDATAANLTRAISAAASSQGAGSDLSVAVLDAATETLKRQHDTVHGGFGQAPKFPQAMALDFLLHSWARTGDAECLAIVEKSLVAMSHGGIWDHLAGGFARYSTDEAWLAPHFEKMLYDQALLAQVYLHAFQATGQSGYGSAVTRTIDYVLRDLTSTEGGFMSAEDADSEGVEGKFYTWSYEEAESVLGDDLAITARTFDITPGGNWEGTNILHVVGDRNNVPADLGMSVEDYRAGLARGRGKLLDARSRRVRPARDDKVLTAWNGLMLAAVAEAAAVLGREDYLAAARRNAELMLSSLLVDGRLRRTYRDGVAKLDAYLEDYAALAAGLLQLYQADFDPRWYAAATGLAETMLELFSDPGGGLFYSTSEAHTNLLFRPREFEDNAVPAGNSLAIQVLLELYLLSGDDRYRTAAESAARPLAGSLAGHPLFFGRLLSALSYLVASPREVALIGEIGSDATRAMLAETRGRFLGAKVVAAGPEGSRVPALLADRPGSASGSAAYVCRNFACLQPVSTPEDLRAQLSAPPATPEWASI